jgi:excinuclease ABC subunit C
MFWGRKTEKSDSAVLYVGKSRKLRNRVRQYFAGHGDGRPFVRFIQQKTEEIRYILVGSEQEALVLENELIKKYKPAYNILLKDDKRYLSIRIDYKHEWPRMDVVRKIYKDGAFYLGPFSSSTQLRMTLDYMQKIFPLRTCNDHKLYNRARPCMEYEIKRCVAPCVKYIDTSEYKKIVEGAMDFLKGNHSDLLQDLETQMESAAAAERYEEAARLRDRMKAIGTTIEGHAIIGFKQLQQGIDQDAVGIAIEGAKAVVVLLFVRHGIVLDKRVFEFDHTVLDRESLVIEFLNRYYSTEVYQPHEILIPFVLDRELLDIDVAVLQPRSDEKKKFVDLADENAKTHLQAALHRAEKTEEVLTSLKTALHLSVFPQRIDCVDISHHQGAETVASVVRFYDGHPEKSGYRRIKLTVDQVNDFDSMKEALSRRYKTSDDLPDLLVIDGGKGQLSSACHVLDAAGFLKGLNVVSLAKPKDGETIDPLNPKNREKIFKPGQKNPILLKEGSAEERLLQFLRDEAHRFAITYHRERKVRYLTQSVLDDVPGLTPRLKVELLKKFKKIDDIIEAPDDILRQDLPPRVIKALRLTLRNALVKV